MKIESFTFKALNIEMVATGSTADMKNPNCKLYKYSNGYIVNYDPFQKIRLNKIPAIRVLNMA